MPRGGSAVREGLRGGIHQVDVALGGVLLAQGVLDEGAGLLGLVGVELGLIAGSHRVEQLLAQHVGCVGLIFGFLGDGHVVLGKGVSVIHGFSPCGCCQWGCQLLTR